MSETAGPPPGGEPVLRVSGASFAAIADISSDAIIVVDEGQRIVYFNRGAETIFGYTADEAVGQPLDLLLPERFRNAHEHHVQGFGRSPERARRMGERQEISGVRKNGEEFPADASISKLDVGGRRLFTAVLRDITHRKRAEQAQQLLARAGALLASSLDLDATLRSVVELAVPILGDWAVIYLGDGEGALRRQASAHADPGRTPLLERLNDFPIDSRSAHPANLVIETGRPELLESISDRHVRAMAFDDEHARILRELGMTSGLVVPLAVRDAGMGAIGLYRGPGARRYDEDDLTLAQDLALRAALAIDNARLYREAQQAVRARDDVLAVASHDLGNSLSAIRIGTGLLLRRLPPEERETGGWKYLESIRGTAEQMERLINDLLEVKRLEAGHLRLVQRSEETPALVERAVEAVRPMASEKSLVVDTSVPEQTPPVYADRERVLQVFSNLLGNAIKFTPDGGRIEVRAEASGGFVVFAVADTGPGIAEEELPSVFERFWRGKRSRHHGSGLGLAIAKGVVESHGGRIWAESSLGAGTTFYFTLPVEAVP